MILKYSKSIFLGIALVASLSAPIALAQGFILPNADLKCDPGQYVNGTCITPAMKASACPAGGNGTVEAWEVCDPGALRYEFCSTPTVAIGYRAINCNTTCSQATPAATCTAIGVPQNFTESDPTIGTLGTAGQVCTTDGVKVNCSSDLALIETDPKIGTLTDGQFCTADTTGKINCQADALTSFTETDPTLGNFIGTITNGQFCTAVNGKIECNATPPTASQVWQSTVSPADAGVYYNGGNVGIGTNVPAELAEIASASGIISRLRITDVDAGENPEMQLKFGSTITDHWGIYVDKYANNALKFWSGSDRLTLASSGNVGIGVSAPAAKLDVAGDILVNGIAIGRGLGNWDSNTAVGMTALALNTAGIANTAIGQNTLSKNTAGSLNIAVGTFALNANTTGGSNTAIGANALLNNTTGSSNTAIGEFSGQFIANGTAPNQTSSNSIYLGYGTKALANGDTNEIVIGASAIGAGSNSVVLGNDSITKTVLKGSVSIGNNLLTQTDGGLFFGRVKLSENQWNLTNFGDDWQPKDSNRTWTTVAMSSDGRIQTAAASSDSALTGQLYISTDYGNAWTAKGNNLPWFGVAMSSDGKIQTAVSSNFSYQRQIYVSTDYGNTWNAKATNASWRNVAMSSDGKIQTATVWSGQIYVSTDYGNTWNAKANTGAWHGVAMSSDGKIQTATVQSGQIYVSTDSGNTWVAKDSSRNWRDVAMSSDGKIQTATVQSGQIYVSTDSGNTWVAKDSSRVWSSIAMSSDGKIQTATVQSGQIYVSTDYGNTWTAKATNKYWRDVAMSSDGKIQTALDNNNGRIYVSYADSVMNGNGNVGIGTQNPSTALEVMGTATIKKPPLKLLSGSVTYMANGSPEITGANTRFTTELSVGDRFVYGTQTGVVIAITNDSAITLDTNSALYGAVSPIYTQGPDTILDVQGGIKVQGDAKIQGNVGIGTSNPTAKLDVQGDVKISGQIVGNLTIGGAIVQEAWLTPTLLNSWVNYGASATYQPASYFKDKNGIVHLKGLVTGGTAGTIFTLPTGYRPLKQLLMPALHSGAVSRLDITSAGSVVAGSTFPAGWFTLDGISFRAEQ